MPAQSQPNGFRFLENLAYLVPGYQGYKRRSGRREEDARLRARVVSEVQHLMRRLEALRGIWSENGSEIAAEQIDHRRLRLEAIAESLRCAPYRARAFFEREPLAELMLDQLLEADLLILQDLDDARSLLPDGVDVTAPQNLAEFFGPFDESCGLLERHLIIREKTLATV